VQSLRWIYRPIEFLTECKRRYGDAFTVRFAGFPPFVVTSRPDEIKAVFTADPSQVHAGGANIILKPLLGARSLLLLDGADHIAQRRLMMPAFHGERMHAYGEVMRQIIDRTIDGLPLGRPFALQSEMQDVTLQVILRTVFGIEEGASFTQLARLLRRLLMTGEQPHMLLMIGSDGEVRWRGLHDRFPRLSPWHRFRRMIDEVDQVLYAEIDRRRARAVGGGEDVLSLLIEAKDEAGRGLTDVELRDEMMTLLVAGHETTATSLAWIMARLLEHPAALAKLRQRLEEGDVEYLDAVIRETLRLNPIVPMVGRELQAPLEVGGRTLEKGTLIAPSIYLTQRRPDVWADAERWDPERFVGAPKVSPFEFFPFGGGARRCLGMAFALYEMRVVLTQLVQRTSLRIRPGYRGGLRRRGVTFAPNEGLPVICDRAPRPSSALAVLKGSAVTTNGPDRKPHAAPRPEVTR
jgi:cytochrome P450